jgi:hypothetical protein
MQAGSRTDPLLADFQPARIDPVDEWRAVYWAAGSRAQRLVDDFPVAAAMVRAKLLGTHGADGLRFRSLYAVDDDMDTSSDEERMRVTIDACVNRGRRFTEASGVMSRREFDWMLDQIATIYGDSFAIRVGRPRGRPRNSGSSEPMTHWRIVHPWRVVSPSNRSGQGDEWLDGGRFINGRLVSIAYSTGERIPHVFGWAGDMQEVFLYAPDGTPNVVHRRGMPRIGHWRGVTMFAPLILESRLLQGLGVAYVASKRTQASHPLMIRVQDIDKAREQYAGTRIANLLLGPDDEVTYANFKFEGSDYREFYDAQLRSLCAPWGIPWELVMGDHSQKSGASARSTWQAYWMTSAQYQADFIEQVSIKVDESYVREDVALGKIVLPADPDWSRVMRGKYLRPPRIMPDPHKEAQAVEAWRAQGVSPTTLFALAGFDYQDERRQAHQDEVFEEQQNPKDASDDEENALPLDNDEDDGNSASEVVDAN